MDLSLKNIRAKNPGACNEETAAYARAIHRDGDLVTPHILRLLDRQGYLRYAVNLLTAETQRTIILYLNTVDPNQELYRFKSNYNFPPNVRTEGIALQYILAGIKDWPAEIQQMIADICNDQEDL